MGLKRRKSSFVLLHLSEAGHRLASMRLARAHRELINSYIQKDQLAQCLWVDGSWEPGDAIPADLDPTTLAAVIFATPINTTRSIVLTTRSLFGVRSQRNHFLALFLEPVRCRDFCVVPDTLTIFAGGLTVKRIACFDGGDSHTEIARHLHAPYVLTGFGYGDVYFQRGLDLKVRRYAKQLPKRPHLARRFETISEVFPFVGDTVKDLSAWEFVCEFIDDKKQIPKGKAFDTPAISANEIRGNCFFFVGRFAHPYASAADAKRIVEYNGGRVAKRISNEVNFLVVGDIKSALISNSPKSMSQLDAEQLNTNGASIEIISETQFWEMPK